MRQMRKKDPWEGCMIHVEYLSHFTVRHCALELQPGPLVIMVEESNVRVDTQR